jgi:hypothetical protein
VASPHCGSCNLKRVTCPMWGGIRRKAGLREMAFEGHVAGQEDAAPIERSRLRWVVALLAGPPPGVAISWKQRLTSARFAAGRPFRMCVRVQISGRNSSSMISIVAIFDLQ